MMKYKCSLETDFGILTIIEENEHITNIYFSVEESFYSGIETKETRLLKEAVRQLREYFAGTRKYFQLPLNP